MNIRLDQIDWEVSACAQPGVTTNFFPEQGNNYEENVAEAKALCKSCPLQAQCLQYSIDVEEFGIWGGYTPRERKNLGKKFAVRSVDATGKTRSVSEVHLSRLRTSNTERTLAAAPDAIRKLQEALAVLSNVVPKEWVEAAELRIAHPTSSLHELAQMYDPVMTRDAYSGRLRRLIAVHNKSK